MECSTNYTDISFSCTNTMYLDSNGDADGVTVFVSTECGSNERLPFSQQDAKYSNFNNNIPLLVPGQVYAFPANSAVRSFGEGAAAPDPSDVDTCNWGCICGYSPNTTQISSFLPLLYLIYPAYLFCQCDLWLQTSLDEQFSRLPATAAEISILDHYYVNCTGLVTNSTNADYTPFTSPLECFGDPLTVGTAVFQYM